MLACSAQRPQIATMPPDVRTSWDRCESAVTRWCADRSNGSPTAERDCVEHESPELRAPGRRRRAPGVPARARMHAVGRRAGRGMGRGETHGAMRPRYARRDEAIVARASRLRHHARGNGVPSPCSAPASSCSTNPSRPTRLAWRARGLALVPVSALATFAASAALAVYARGVIAASPRASPGRVAHRVRARGAARRGVRLRFAPRARARALPRVDHPVRAAAGEVGARLPRRHPLRPGLPRARLRARATPTARCSLRLVASPRRAALPDAVDAARHSPGALQRPRAPRAPRRNARPDARRRRRRPGHARPPRSPAHPARTPAPSSGARAPRAWIARSAPRASRSPSRCSRSPTDVAGAPTARAATLRPTARSCSTAARSPASSSRRRSRRGRWWSSSRASSRRSTTATTHRSPRAHRGGTPDEHRARVAARSLTWAALAWAAAALAGAPPAAWAGVSVAADRHPAPEAPVRRPRPSRSGCRGRGARLRAQASRSRGRTGRRALHGTLLDGTQFDSSREHDRPFTFRYGAGRSRASSVACAGCASASGAASPSPGARLRRARRRAATSRRTPGGVQRRGFSRCGDGSGRQARVGGEVERELGDEVARVARRQEAPAATARRRCRPRRTHCEGSRASDGVAHAARRAR